MTLESVGFRTFTVHLVMWAVLLSAFGGLFVCPVAV